MNMRFEEGRSYARRSGLSRFVSEHPYLSLFVSMTFGAVVGNFLQAYL